MNFDEYKNNLSCPIKPKRVCPKCRLQYGDLDNFCAGCGKDVRGYYKQEYSKYLEQVKKYRKQDVELIEKFKYDSLSAIGLIDHPKSDGIFSFAWDHGHSSGYHEVYYWLQEISDLFKD